MSGIVPPVGSQGVYSVAAPYTLTANLPYTCIAVRAFLDLTNDGIDIYRTFYSPLGLSQSVYTADSQNGVVIVGLQGSDGSLTHIPSSYMLGAPDQSGVVYQNVVVAVPLGLLPQGFDLGNVLTSMNSLVTDMVGVTGAATAIKTPLTEIVSQDQAVAIEAGRQGMINNQTSDRSLYQTQLALNAVLQDQIAVLTKLCVSKGLITTTT